MPVGEEIIIKTYDADIKEVKDERALDVTITTTIRDRDKDIVEAKGGKLSNYRKNPVVLLAHDYRGLAIAKAEKIDKTDDKIIARVVFPPEGDYPLADVVYRLYKNKFMRGWSIGFIPLKWEYIKEENEKDGESISRGRRIKSWELLEFSACAIPSNPEALTNMVAKGIDIKPLKEAGVIEIEEEVITKNEDLVKEVCPKCGADVEVEEDGGDSYSHCLKCDWDDSDLEGKTTNLVLTENVAIKIEETEEYIRIPAKGEEGKHKGHKIRWITVSAKEGIKGIYCIDCKKIITFVFDKKKGWTLEKAKKWMEEHGKNIEELEVVEKGVIPFKETPKAPEGEAWDATKEVREAEVSDLKIMCAWFDSANPDIKSSYKLPHHKAKGHAVVWRAVVAAMAALFGARGGVNIPAGDRKGVYNHLVKHYKQFGKEPPEFRDYNEEELKELFCEEEEKQNKVFNINEIYEIIKENKELKEKVKGLELKAGAVLNAKNKNNLKQAQKLIQEVLDSAETTEGHSVTDAIDNNKNNEINGEYIELVTDTVDSVKIDEVKNEEIEDKIFEEKIKEIINKSMAEVKKHFENKINYVTGRIIE